MRWMFLDPEKKKEAAYQRKKLSQIDSWWAEFEKKAPAIDALFRGEKKWDIASWMGKTLQAIESDLMWEYGPGVKGKGHRLVITPEARRELRPLTATILERAPKLKGWEFYPYRLPESLENAEATVQGRTGGTLADTTVDVRIGEANRIDLTFYSPQTQGEDDHEALNVAFVATESLLGEELLDHWVGGIGVEPAPRKPQKGQIALDRLAGRFEAVRSGISEQLPAKSCAQWIEKAEWSGLKLDPEGADDYPGFNDLMVAITGNLELWKACHSDVPFFSQRYSRCGESFVYIKIDGIDGLDGSKFGDRSDIEDAINNELGKEKLGTVIGGGTGLRYSYSDLALTHLRRGVEVICHCLRKGKIPRRTWVLFFDADLRGEWVGVYDNTPAPPGHEEE